ncbi:peptidoglycan-binding domain-containing protein [Plantactinospora endophytica]
MFGPDTEGAVRDFQTWCARPADGMIGTTTWNALHGSCNR